MKLKVLNIKKNKKKLHSISEPVSKDKLMDAYKLGKEMLNLLDGINTVGLSAPQIGILDRVIVIKLGSYESIIINPRIVLRTKKRVKAVEGCLSFNTEDLYLVERVEGIKVAYVDGLNNQKLEQFFGAASVVVQHEIDHLNGITMDQTGKKLDIKEESTLTPVEDHPIETVET